MHGWIILDKPSGISSAHAVAKVKRWLRPSKIGHAGTLDPLASGILPLALGEATKTVAYMMDASKAYRFTVGWGEERDTDDSAGQVTQRSELRPALEAIDALLPQFTGRISQTPPQYSAIKIDGKRAYDVARSGETAAIKSRDVEVHSLLIEPSPLEGEGRMGGILQQTNLLRDTPHPEPGAPSPPPQGGREFTSFVCHCGKGTYIRSLARDMGRILGCFGHVTQLRRLQVGNFDENHAISLEVLAEMVHKNDLSFLRPVDAALDDIPACEVTHDQATRLTHGQILLLPPGSANGITQVRNEGKLIALCNVSQGLAKPVRVFNL